MDQDLMAVATQMEQEIMGATSDQRLELQPKFSETIARMQNRGLRVPLRLKRLEATLSDEAVEAKFDNMPV